MDASPLIALALTVGLGLWLWRTVVPAPPPSGPLRIAPTDPLLAAARERARAELGTFRALLRDRREHAQIKVVVPGPEYAGQWCDVLGWDERGLRVRERGPMVERALEWADVEDWLVETEDGLVRGGFTVVAAWRVREREAGRLPAEARRELGRFVDA